MKGACTNKIVRCLRWGMLGFGHLSGKPPMPRFRWIAGHESLVYSVQENANQNITTLSTACRRRMAHRKWKDTKQQTSMLPGPAVLG